MGLIKKIDVDKHFAARRAMRLGRSGPLSETGFRIERTVKTTSAAGFIEKAPPEHSALDAPVPPVPLAADSDGTSVSTVSRSRQA
jgi:hypothetical protein